MNEEIDKVVEHLLESGKYCYVKRSLFSNGSPISKTNFSAEVNFEMLQELGLTTWWVGLGWAVQKVVVPKIYEQLLGRVKTVVREENSSLLSAFKYYPAVCPLTGRRFLLDKETNLPSGFDYDAVVGALPLGARVSFEEEIRFVIAEYDPYDLSRSKPVEVEGNSLLKINTYTPPTWRLEPPQADTMPEIFEEFFCRLFPSVECRTYIYHWLFNAIMHRNETILVLNGVKGIGKGVFCSLVKGLVGADNYTEAAVATLDTQFNSILVSKRVIVFDEIEVSKKEHTRLKRYTNDRQTIELKGKDAKSSVEVFNSYIISNNDTSDMYLEADDRRFSVAECTKVPMRQSTTPEQREELIATLDNEVLIGQLGHWILANGCQKKWDTFTEFKGVTFFKLVFNSLYAWQKFMVEYALDNEQTMSYRELSKTYRKESGKDAKLPGNISKVEDFLNNYLHNGEHRIGEMVRDGGEWYFYPTLLSSMNTDVEL